MNNYVTYNSVVSFLEMLAIRCKVKTDVSGYILDILVPKSISTAKCDFIKGFIERFIPIYVVVEVQRKLRINWPKKVSTKDMRKQSSCIKVKR